MEASFDPSWGSNGKLNQFFYSYESDVLTDHLLSLCRTKPVGDGEDKDQINSMAMNKNAALKVAQADNAPKYILFEDEGEHGLKERLEGLPSSMENPYEILVKFIKWEMYDLEAMIQAIDRKNELSRRKEKIQEDK